MDDTSLNAHPSWIPSPAPVLSTFELDAFKRRTSLIQTTVNKFLDDEPSRLQKRVVKDVLIKLIKNRKLWIFVERDQDYCLSNDPIMDSDSDSQEEEECKLSPQDVDTVKKMLGPDDAFLQLAAQTTLAIRIGMIIWLVITSLAVQDRHLLGDSAWDKWDIQGRAITIWADTYSKIMHSKKCPSEAIPTDDDAVAAFQSAMDIAGHHHDYQATPDLGAWVTMRAALFPELKGTELACWHFNDEDGCSLCDERFQEKLQSETGLDHMPPLHLAALWDYFRHCEDFEERVMFAVFQRPHLFSPEVVKPVKELLAQRFPEKTRRTHGLHYELSEHDPVVDLGGSIGATEYRTPSWQKMEDMIDSLAQFAPKYGRDRYFPPIEPIFWFDMIRVLDGQYQSQDKGKEPSWRPRVSLAVAYKLDEKVLGEEFPPLNVDLLPEYVQRAVKQFRLATERDEHSCDIYYFGFQQTWGRLDVKYCVRYAAAYAQLYSTDSVPLLGDDENNCGACSDIRALYDCVDSISAGQITLGSQDISKVLGFIKQLAEDRSDVDNSDDRSESSESLDDQQRASNSEVIHDETHNAAIVTENEMNPFDPTALTQPEASFGWQEPHSATQIYNFTRQAPLIEYTTMIEANASVQEHVGGFTNVWDPPKEDSEHLPFRATNPDSSLGSYIAPHTTWLTKQPPQLKATDNVAAPSQPKDNVGPKISKEAKKKELHAFFVTLFKKHDVPLGTTGMAEARLPWKKMTSILADQGLEIAGWPEGVPKPRSHGKADKGISGFNTEHIAALYKAMKAGQIDFRPLAGRSPTNDAPRVQQREDDMEDEGDIRSSKKGKLAETRRMAKAFVAGKSVMKF
ncbi:hypothetical protein C8R44DRAFT_848539 [Mycena epipterygia]|nr:hypothetical protein C8R44DRAFT_848539 [Mycena epipterygia]